MVRGGGIRRGPGRIRGEGLLILFITGTTEYPFERLLRKADEIAPHFQDRFLLQTGPFDFTARNCDTFGLVGYDQLMERYRACDLVVSHTSSGPLIYASRFERPIIAIPRRKRMGEALADHQVETAAALKRVEEPMRMVLDEVDGLEEAVRKMMDLKRQGIERYTTGKAELLSLQAAIRLACEG